MDYKVSIVIPVYKAEEYLKECVDSVLSQTLDGVEIILVDDGSPDQCSEICDTYAAQYDSIVVLHIQNGGPSRARNMGLALARGKYIGFADADDYVQPEMYERLYREAEENQADIVMCGYSTDDGKEKQSLKMEYAQEYCGHATIVDGLSALYCTRYHNGLYSVWNKLFDKNLLYSHHITFDEDLIRAEDAWFVFDCLKVAEKVRFVNESLYNYRPVLTSTMHTVQADRYERSKAFRNKVIRESEALNIQIDWNELYYEFLYEAFVYCRLMVKQGRNQEVHTVLNDDYFYAACLYSKLLPDHLKFLCKLERLHMKVLLFFVLKLWSKQK